MGLGASFSLVSDRALIINPDSDQDHRESYHSYHLFRHVRYMHHRQSRGTNTHALLYRIRRRHRQRSQTSRPTDQ
jgi:hypothetical protein